MSKKDKVEFEEYNIEFNEHDFDNLQDEELKECKKIIEDIKNKLED